MKQKKDATNTLLMLVMAIAAIVALFVLFADAFQDPTRGTGFAAMFYSYSANRNAVPGMIAAFVLLIIAIVLPFVSPLFAPQGKVFIYGAEAVLLAVAAVLFLFAPAFYKASNNITYNYDITLGGGLISSITFAFIGAAFALLGVMHAKKEIAR
jgi:hypothetical protein